ASSSRVVSVTTTGWRARSASCTLTLHDALPILCDRLYDSSVEPSGCVANCGFRGDRRDISGAQHRQDRELARNKYLIDQRLDDRSEEHTSELQSLRHLVCRLLLEIKNSIEVTEC